MNPRTCSVGAEQLLSYLDNPASQPGLEEHIAGCYFCQVRLLAMAGGARTRGAARSECQKVLQEIPALMAVEASGGAMAERFWPIQVHLLLCNDCFEAYRDLRRMQEMILDDTLPLPPLSAYRPPDLSLHEMILDDTLPLPPLSAAYRPPDLSFLHNDDQPRRPALLQTLRLSLALLFQPRQGIPAFVRTDQVETTSFAQPTFERVWGAEELGELSVEVKLYPDATNTTQVRLEVTAHQVTRFDAKGIRVELQVPDAPAIVGYTDSLGLVEFEGLTEGDLRMAVLEITPAPPGDPPRA